MAFNLTAGNPRAHRIRVYFEGETTIYEGMPVCYNYDTTDNWFGGSVSNGEVSATTTTAEGSQNEGKYIRVELPSSSNLNSFAGVVAKGGWCGTTGPKSIDIYIPNGAIVPVRCDVDTTTGRTILCIQAAQTELGYLISGAWCRPVAIAMETETGLDDSTDITLAELNPSLFISQQNYGDSLIVSTGSGTCGQALNKIDITNSYPAGQEFNAFEVKSDFTGGANAPYGMAAYFRTTQSATMSDHAASVGVIMSISGGTSTEYVTALKVKMHSGSSATMTSVANLSVLNLESHIATTGPTPFSWIYIEGNGAVDPNYFLYVKSKGELGDHAAEGNLTTTTAGDRMIPISFGGSVYYLAAYADDDVA